MNYSYSILGSYFKWRMAGNFLRMEPFKGRTKLKVYPLKIHPY